LEKAEIGEEGRKEVRGERDREEEAVEAHIQIQM
jgi:hypothetical protein